MQVCANCGTSMGTKPRWARFCSRLCNELASGKRAYGPHGYVITCAVCDERKAVRKQGAAKVCHGCLPEWDRRRGAAWREANPDQVREAERRRPSRHEYHRARYAEVWRARRGRSDRSCEGCGAALAIGYLRKKCEECR